MAISPTEDIILIDFGSTYTKMVLISLGEERVRHTASHASTVKTDAMKGLRKCLGEAEEQLGFKRFRNAMKLASSSAAGGLKMAVIGISKDVSLRAGRSTAFGAGAKILHAFAGKLTEADIEALVEDEVEILLLCGGYEKGNQSIPLFNAHLIAKSDLSIPVIYAGNSQVAQEIRYLLSIGQKECYIVDNIVPEIGVINSAPAERIVRDLFLTRIINMKGLERVKQEIDGILMPTPSAVLAAGELLATGTETERGIEDLMIVDVGGATTDIYSFTHTVVQKGAKLSGSAENYRKRTVESDLGLRESVHLLLESVGFEKVRNELKIEESRLHRSVDRRAKNVDYIPHTLEETRIDELMARYAVRISAERHAGYLEPVHASQHKFLQRGKNLTMIRHVLGTGGPIINSQNHRQVLAAVLKEKVKDPYLLLPEEASFYLDRQYILYSMGLMKEYFPNAAFRILKKSLTPLP